MFRNWGFLLGEIWLLVVLAALIGLLAGWLIWGRRSSEAVVQHDSGEEKRLRDALAACENRQREAQARIAGLEADLNTARDQIRTAADPAPAVAAPGLSDPPETPKQQKRPEALAAPRDGQADDLKLIKGVGPVLEALLHRLGFFHFDQIANWTSEEINWVDENLEGFKGRVTRDEWVAQARDLAAGQPPRPGGKG